MYKKNYVPKSKGEMLYTSKFGVRQMLPKIGSLLIYIGTFVLWLYLNSVYYNFGTKIITPLTGAMWILGAVLAIRQRFRCRSEDFRFWEASDALRIYWCKAFHLCSLVRSFSCT